MFTNRSKQNSENETKFVQERITLAERNVAELCIAFGAYARKAARLRDVGDELSGTIQQYANADLINHSFSTGLTNFAISMNTVNGYGDKRVQYIDNKVVAQLTPYESICKNMKDSVKNIFVTKDKEVLRQRQLDRIKERNPRNRQQIVEAESELVHAKAEVSRTIHNLEDKIVSFERQKLHDLKEILLDFICTEIGYHSKAISYLTEAYTSIDAINIDNDVEDVQKAFDELDPKFKSTLRNPSNKTDEKILSKHLSQSMGTLNSSGKKGIPNNSKHQKQKKAMSEETIYQEEDDNDDSPQSETEFTDSETDDNHKPPTNVKALKKVASRKYLQ